MNHDNQEDNSNNLSTKFGDMNEDVLSYIQEFLGKESFFLLGSINKQCYKLFEFMSMPKKTHIGLLPITTLEQYYEDKCRALYHSSDSRCSSSHISAIWQVERSIGRSIVKYNRNDIFRDCSKTRMGKNRNILKNMNILTEICNRAALAGNLDLIKEIYYSYNEETNEVEEKARNSVKQADEEDDAHSEKELTRLTLRNGKFILCYAVKSNSLSLVKWLLEERFDAVSSICLDYAIHEGNVEMLDLLHRNGLNTWKTEELMFALSQSSYYSNMSFDSSDQVQLENEAKKNKILRWIEENRNDNNQN